MNPYKKLVLDIALYIVLFVAIQLVITIVLAIGFLLYKGLPFTQLQTLMETDLTLTIVANIVSSALLANPTTSDAYTHDASPFRLCSHRHLCSTC